MDHHRASGLTLALGALKNAEDGDEVIVRVYGPLGAQGRATLDIGGLVGAERVNLLELGDHTVPVQGTCVRPFEVITLKLRLAAPLT